MRRLRVSTFGTGDMSVERVHLPEGEVDTKLRACRDNREAAILILSDGTPMIVFPAGSFEELHKLLVDPKFIASLQEITEKYQCSQGERVKDYYRYLGSPIERAPGDRDRHVSG